MGEGAQLEQTLTPRHRKVVVLLVKRAFDIVFAGMGLVVAMIPMVILACLVRSRLGRPVLFTQVRPGKGGKPFRMYKFRTMRDAVNEEGTPLSDDERLTPFGRKLRVTSLDELPSLWNILKGDMSLVGPRPLLERYTAYFRPDERIRLEVRPGLTGWAQTQGRNTVSWDRRLAYDTWYVEHMSLALDLRIIAMTFGRVLRADGVVVDPVSIMRDLDEERNGMLNA